MEPDSRMSSSDPCAHDDDQDHGHAATRAGRQARPSDRPGARGPAGLLDNAGAERGGRDQQGQLRLHHRIGRARNRLGALDPRRRVERAGAVQPALVDGAGQRAPPLRPPQDRDPRGAGHRRADRDQPVRAGRRRRRFAARAPRRRRTSAGRPTRWSSARWSSTSSSRATSTARGTSCRATCCAPTPSTRNPISTRRGRCCCRFWRSEMGSPGPTAWAA